MNKKAFGLDIGLSSIKAVWLGKLKDDFVVDASISSPSTAKGMMSESPLDEEEMARAIAKTVSDAKITSRLVSIALPDNQVYTKVVEMPDLSDKELSSAIYWEAEQHIPVPLSTVTLAWNILSRPTKGQAGGKMQVLMVGAPMLLIKKYQKIIGMTGLSIKFLETEILSIVRALIPNETFPPSIIINIGSVNTSLAIVRDGVMIFTFSIPTGGMAINRAIISDFGLSPDQAEQYKKSYGVSDKALGGKIGKVAEPILNTIMSEVRKALAFYAEKYKNDKPVRQILLTGGTAKLPGIDLFFTQASNIETAIANPWKVLSQPNSLPPAILENGPDYTIAVGLAMRDYEE